MRKSKNGKKVKVKTQNKSSPNIKLSPINRVPTLKNTKEISNAIEETKAKILQEEEKLKTLSLFLTDELKPLDKKNGEALTKLFVEIEKKMAQVNLSTYENEMLMRSVHSYLVNFIADYDFSDELAPIFMKFLEMNSDEVREQKRRLRDVDAYKPLAMNFDSDITADEIKSLVQDLSNENLVRIFKPKYVAHLKRTSQDATLDAESEEHTSELLRWLELFRPSDDEQSKPWNLSSIARTMEASKSRNEDLLLSTRDILERLLGIDSELFPDRAGDYDETLSQVRAAYRAGDLRELFRLELEWGEQLQERVKTLTPKQIDMYKKELSNRYLDIERLLSELYMRYKVELNVHFIEADDSTSEVDFQKALERLDENIALVEEKTERIKEAKTGKQLVKLLLQPLPYIGA